MEEAPAEKRLLLELFSGTGSIGKAFRAQGWDVVSLDNDPKAHADIRQDVLDFQVSQLGGQTVDLVWASPPCTDYSNARRKKGLAELGGSDELVQKALSIAEELGCPIFVENPWTGQLKNRQLLDHLHLHKVDYCTYGMPYRKRTAIWTDTCWKPARPLCKHDCASTLDGKHIARAQQGRPGPCFSTRQLYVIPPALCEEIALWASPIKDERNSPSTRDGRPYNRLRDQRGRFSCAKMMQETEE